MRLSLAYFLLPLLLILGWPIMGQAQQDRTDSLIRARKISMDSLRLARQRSLDSTRLARQHSLDSMKQARQHQMDSLRQAQQRKTDSLKAIISYRKSDRYKDSVAQVRQQRQDSITQARQRLLDSTKLARQQFLDSMKAARTHTLDSMKQVRQAYTDSLKAHFDSVRTVRNIELERIKKERERRKDSLDAIRAYRESKAYKDSLALIRQQRKDSIIAVRQAYTDSVIAVRKAYTDSVRMERQKYNDSLRQALQIEQDQRRQTIDSMIAARKAVSDSLAQVRAARKAELEEQQKEKEEKKKLAFEMKIEQEQANYSNKKMLKKKWSLLRRGMQNTFTRYNYYYNANLKMEEARSNMERMKQDNYDSLLNLYSFNPNTDSTRLASDMDSLIARASVGIQIHDPRAKWQDDLYLLVGQAYYYKGDYDNAGAAFRQIVVINDKYLNQKKKKKKKKKREEELGFAAEEQQGLKKLLYHQPAKNKAMLWLARTLVEVGEEAQAQSLLDLLRNDPKFPESLKGRLAMEQAFINLQREDYDNAIKNLEVVAADQNLDKAQRLRAGFLLAQLYNQVHKPDNANRFYQKVLDMHPPLEMEFYARKNQGFNQLKDGAGDLKQPIKLFSSLSKERKYHNYYDQIFYGLAMGYDQLGEGEKAEENFKKSIRNGQNNPKQMGLTYTALGNHYYKVRRYPASKMAYDSAALLLSSHPNLPEHQLAELRGTALAMITGPAQTVAELDSLLALAQLSEAEQRKHIRQYLKDLEKHRRDSVFLAENAPGEVANVTPIALGQTSAGGWYFSDPMKVQRGQSAFKQKWGARPLADDWRRSAKGPGTLASNNGSDDGSNLDEAENNQLNLPDEATLYKAIPHGSAAIKQYRDSLKVALFDLGKGYYKYLEDFDNTRRTFDTLDWQFPHHEFSDEVLYLRYLMAMRDNRPSEAQAFLKQLKQQFAESDWTQLLEKQTAETSSKPDSEPQAENTKATLAIDLYYTKVYDLVAERQFKLALQKINSFPQLYPSAGPYNSKMQILEATALAGAGQAQKADSILGTLIQGHLSDTLKNWASTVQKYIQRSYLGQGATEEVSQSPTPLPQKEFIFSDTAAYYLIIAVPADMRAFALRSGLRDFMNMSAKGQGINVSMTTLNPEHNLLVCQRFANFEKVKTVYRELNKNKVLFQEYVSQDYQMVLISEENYPLLLQQKSLKPYQSFAQKHLPKL